MAKKFYETDEFKKTQEEWNAKLEASGFDDIEKSEDGYQLRKEVFDPDTEIAGAIEAEAKEITEKILVEFQFERDIDYIVFKLHSEGKSSREIETYLSAHSTKTLTQRAVVNIINKIKKQYLRTK